MRRFTLAILLGLAAGLWEVAVFPFLPSAFAFRPLLALCVLLLISSRRSRAIAAAVAGGIILDVYAVSAFQGFAIRWAIIILLLDALARHFLTNRSLYATVVLALVARVADMATTWVILGAEFLFFDGSSAFTIPPLSVWIWDVVACALGFLLVAFTTRRYVTFGRVVGNDSGYDA